MTKTEATEQGTEATRERGLGFGELAEQLELPPVWLAASVTGQHPFP